MILGLGGLDHNGAACLVSDGRVLAMLELERVTRRKNHGIDADESLAALLDRLGASHVDHVAVADRTWFAAAAPWLTGCRDLCLAGGVALNGLVNQRLLRCGVVDTLFVPPFTDDRGLAVGAAAQAAYQLVGAA